MVDTTGNIDKLVVEDDSKTGSVTLAGNANIFTVTKDSDSGFNGMVSVLSSAKVTNTAVTLTHDANLKIDAVRLG